MRSVLIIGSGVAGVCLARSLIESGDEHRVTMFEAGPDFRTGDYRVWLDVLMAGKNPYLPFVEDPRTEHERFGLRGSRLFVKGGTTNHWGGETPRFKPEDFELATRTGHGADWPIGYDDLAPHYARAETLLGVEGDSEDDDPPRYGAEYPHPPTPFTRNNQFIMEALESLGLSYAHMPVARNAGKCMTTGTCDYCPVDARYTATFDLARLLADYPDRIELRADAPVIELPMDGKKRARGVRWLDLEGGEHQDAEGDTVVVCSGTFESAKLLLASASPDWLQGIGNDSGHVGRHLVGHPVFDARGVVPTNPSKIHQELIGIVSLVCRHFDSPEYQREGKMLFTMSDGSTTPLERHILAHVSRRDIETNMSSELPLSLGGAMEQFESPENRVSLGAGTTRHGLPTTEIAFEDHELTQRMQAQHSERLIRVLKAAGCAEESLRVRFAPPDGAHATSTCRMSDSESDGVVDGNLRVHGVENLFVCSNAVFPNVAAANPTLTLTALSVRLAEHLGAIGQ